MRKYWAFYRLRFQRTLYYRGSVVVFRLANILMLITLASVWMASQAKGNIGGYTKPDLITYYLIGSLINSIVFWFAGGSIREEIRNGELGAKVLSKPVSYYWQKFFEEFSWHTVAPLFAIISVLFVAFFLRDNVHLHLTIPVLLTMVASVSFASVLFFNLSSCWGLLTFWFVETQGLFTFVWAGIFLFGGQAIPLSFFPEHLRTVINLLPFRYVYSFPLEIYSGRLSQGELLAGFALQILWISIFGLAYIFLWRRGLARYSAYGG